MQSREIYMYKRTTRFWSDSVYVKGLLHRIQYELDRVASYFRIENLLTRKSYGIKKQFGTENL